MGNFKRESYATLHVTDTINGLAVQKLDDAGNPSTALPSSFSALIGWKWSARGGCQAGAQGQRASVHGGHDEEHD